MLSQAFVISRRVCQSVCRIMLIRISLITRIMTCSPKSEFILLSFDLFIFHKVSNLFHHGCLNKFPLNFTSTSKAFIYKFPFRVLCYFRTFFLPLSRVDLISSFILLSVGGANGIRFFPQSFPNFHGISMLMGFQGIIFAGDFTRN